MAEPLDGVSTVIADRYRIDREIARGGMATVYLALDVKHERRVAIKVLHPELAATLGAERFLREIKLTAQLNHPHILPLIDSGDVNGLLYYVMPFVEGQSLRDRLDREKQLPVDEAIAIVREVTDALEYAHRHDVVHRDIKPANILLDEGHAMVADFGIARAINVAAEGRLTATGVTIGTPEYMSPEQAAGTESLDARSDVYAVGCLLYELLAGQPPFTGATANSVIRQHLIAEPHRISDVRSGVPAHVTAALTRALAKAPADRFPSARAFGDALATSTAGVAVAVPARRWLGGMRWVAATAMIVAVIVGTFVVTTMRRRQAATTEPRVAVLPLLNLSPDSSDAYFAQAMHENLTTRLGMIPGLAVTSRSAVLRYRPGHAPPPRAIARDLGVDFLLDGSVKKDSQGVNVSVRLIDARTDTALWAQTYSKARTVASLVDIQSDIASELADALRVRISAEVRGRLSNRPTESAAAYELYLRALQLPADNREVSNAAEVLLKQAIALDPQFLDASAALAHLYADRSYARGESQAWSDSGLALARAAVKSDSDLVAGHHALGILYLDLGHLTQARTAMANVLELQPSHGHARLVLGWIDFLQGRMPEAIASWGEARALDPLNPSVPGDMRLVEILFGDIERAARWNQLVARLQSGDGSGGFGATEVLLAQRSWADALQRAEQLVAKNPNLVMVLRIAARAAIESGNLERARQLLEKLDHTSPDDWDWFGTTYRTSYAYVLEELGQHARARRLLERTLEHAMRLIREGDERPGLRRELAAVHAAMGHRDTAYVWLERAIDAGWRHEAIDPSPLFRPLRVEPRFRALMARVDADLEAAKQRVRSERLGPPLPAE